MSNIKLSVIVPIFNNTEYAQECLQSIIDQLNSGIELVIVDDGSELDTQAMLRQYENRLDNVSVFFKPHKGVAEARNAGIEAAQGEYICFLDGDDKLKEDSLETALELLKTKADLYILGITVLDLTGEKPKEEHQVLADKYYSSVSDFADEYIRSRNLLIYSLCNKLYKRSLLRENRIFMRAGVSFGEDRLFNFAYLKVCSDVVTSKHEMYYYIQRAKESLSKRHIPNFFRLITELNREKTDTFLQLGKGASEEERENFIGNNFVDCVTCTLDRFAEYPEEKAENLPVLNELAFGPSGMKLWKEKSLSCTADILIVLGSPYCETRIEAALEYGRFNPDMIYLVTGGNMFHLKHCTEAEFMRKYLQDNGIGEGFIVVENTAYNTITNLQRSFALIDNLIERKVLKNPAIGIVSHAYHENFIRYCLGKYGFSEKYAVGIYPCIGPYSTPDAWFEDETARRNVLYNLKRTCVGRYEDQGYGR